MSKLYTDSVYYNCKKAYFPRNSKKMKIFDFFYSRPKAEDSFESGGLDLNCHGFEYLIMMY